MELLELCKRAKKAKYHMNSMDADTKNRVLERAASLLEERAGDILKANALDVERGEKNGMNPSLIDRLSLNDKRIKDMAVGLRQIAGLPDPVGRLLEKSKRPNGLEIRKVSVPLGVIGIIYEARPNVTADAFGLCFKAGNAVILKGGSDALESNIAISGILRAALTDLGQEADCIQLIADTSRETTREFMRMNEYVDVLIPRGGAGLIKSVVENSAIPCIETGTGNCHIYVDEYADLDKALTILVNAKTQRVSVCNAAESLVIHETVLAEFLPAAAAALREHGVELRGDGASRAVVPDIIPATEDDYGREYLDYIISVKTAGSIEEAIEHINHYHTGHSDAIVTEDIDNGELFLHEVDSAAVYVNASTRFTDGFEFGFGGEIGISTQRLHARGPMGLRELTTYKYCIQGSGQVRD